MTGTSIEDSIARRAVNGSMRFLVAQGVFVVRVWYRDTRTRRIVDRGAGPMGVVVSELAQGEASFFSSTIGFQVVLQLVAQGKDCSGAGPDGVSS